MLGIDIGSYSIKAAVVKASSRKIKIERIASEIIPAEIRNTTNSEKQIIAVQKIINSLIKKVGSGQKKIALSTPTSSVVLKQMSVDSDLSGDLLEGEILLELMNFVPYPIDQAYFDFVSSGKSPTDPSKQNITVVVSKKDAINSLSNLVNHKSIKDKEVDIEAFAYSQLIERLNAKNDTNNYALIDIGHKLSRVYVFNKGNLVFNREQQIGGEQLTELIADYKGINSEEAESVKLKSFNTIDSNIIITHLDSISEQFALALEFFSSSNSSDIKTTYITGGGSLIPGLLENIRENIPHINFEVLPFGKTIKISQKTNGIPQSHIYALGALASSLSMRK